MGYERYDFSRIFPKVDELSIREARINGKRLLYGDSLFQSFLCLNNGLRRFDDLCSSIQAGGTSPF